jgi:hypothetical protein
VIGVDESEISVAMGTVFILNAAALYLFPVVPDPAQGFRILVDSVGLYGIDPSDGTRLSAQLPLRLRRIEFASRALRAGIRVAIAGLPDEPVR